MLKKSIKDILSASKEYGWVLEPDAINILTLSGIETPRHCLAMSIEECGDFVKSNGYPLVAKVVSPLAMHKSDLGGVIVGIKSEEELLKAFRIFRKVKGFKGVLVEEMVSGVELIVGAKVDYQFGPVILLGMGGTGVEIYQDVSLRMAPLKEGYVEQMVRKLKGRGLIEGYRGSDPVNMKKLTSLLMSLSHLVMNLGNSFESIDLNPVMCSSERCVVADARIILNRA